MTYEPGNLKADFSAVASYHLDDKVHSHLQLAPVEQVIDQLAGPNAKTLFLDDISSQVPEEQKGRQQVRDAIDVLNGSHSSGFRMTIVEAAHEGEVVYVPVLHDDKRNLTLVVTPVTPEDRERHERVSVVYTQDFASQRDVNRFVDKGMEYRRSLSGKDEPLAEITAAVLCAVVAAAGGAPYDPDSGEIQNSIGGALIAVAKNRQAAAYSVATQKLENGKLAEKLDPVRFRDGTEEAFGLKKGSLSLRNGVDEKKKRAPARNRKTSGVTT